MKYPVHNEIKVILDERLLALEAYFDSDVLFFYGSILPGLENMIRNLIESLKKDESRKNKLSFIINTPGGSVETTEQVVSILREHYEIVNFIVPNAAYSAGTILCLSGDDIYMEYSSFLGPTDPQVENKEGKYVPALGYVDFYNSVIEKSKAGKLTFAELELLKTVDIAVINSYTNAKKLTIDLIQHWLVKYKFKNWTNHSDGRPVSDTEKKERAASIADKLGNNNYWKSHSRGIGIDKLTDRDVLNLKIINYGNMEDLRNLIRKYNDFIIDYIRTSKQQFFFHTRNYI